MSQPTVSVVLPVYNPGKYLTHAIGSIIDQSYQDWELICVNDGSTDQSREVLDWFAYQDKRIRVYHQENSGVVAAANRGGDLARGLDLPHGCRRHIDARQNTASSGIYEKQSRVCGGRRFYLRDRHGFGAPRLTVAT